MATKSYDDWQKLPRPEEPVERSVRDVKKIAKGLGAKDLDIPSEARKMVQAGGKRAAMRTAGRAVPAVGAAMTGYELGEELDKRTGAGKWMVNAAMGEPKEDGDRGAVELSKAAKEQLEEDQQASGRAKAKAAMGMPADRAKYNYAKGGSVRGGGCEQRGKTKGRML